MKYRTGNEIRQLFLDYFASKGHMIEPSANLVPKNDPTLLWINAGVAALKKYFDGSEKPKSNRITNAQKSIRTNDIENVGKTARHHTFFEMLGNFSIGDYFKEDAIPFAWEFLTSEEYIGLPKEKLYVSVYTDDDEAYKIWTTKTDVNPTHILKTDDNFWEIGEGPSGPDSEIFYDRGEKYDPEGLGEKLFFDELENDRYIEVWNIVFSQFDAKPELPRSEYKELPQKNIDTGMGLERLVSIVQDGETNFDTDLFLPIINEVEKMSLFPYEGQYKMAYRVIADHIRTITFALSDGALFSNNGRGYVLRRVLRRAVRYGMKLGLDKPFMYELVNIVVNNMKEFYPYLEEKADFCSKLIKVEEEAFHKTLSNGEKLLNEELSKLKESDLLSGKVVFKLYDTYGFPFELTEEIALEQNIKVDKKGFEQEMQKQKDRARNARDGEQSMSSQSKDLLEFDEKFDFVGYDHSSINAKITGLFVNGEMVDELSHDGVVIVDKSCFYAEMGGQVSDKGTLVKDNAEIEIYDVQKAPRGQFMHFIKNSGNILKVGDSVELYIDNIYRKDVEKNHSATHLLHSALRQVIGSHISQSGSYENNEYLRFDFTHFEKITDSDLDKVEKIVNEKIQQAINVITEELSIEAAKKTGAMALFDEKYGDIVRVVSMGDFSKELCGGCHVTNTSEIGLFKIISEESVGSGIRRITAFTGKKALEYFNNVENKLNQISEMLKLKNKKDLIKKVESLIDENNDLMKKIEEIKYKQVNELKNTLLSNIEEVNGIEYLVAKVNGIESKMFKQLAVDLRDGHENRIIFLSNENEDKLTFVASAGIEVIDRGIKCGDLVKEAAAICDGKGGGKPDLAQAGGKDLTKLNDAISFIEKNIIDKL